MEETRRQKQLDHLMSDAQDNINQAGHADAANVELFDFYVAQLEAYLDGELDSEEAQQVRRRLMQEEAYAAALGRLHSQRIQRIEAYKRIEHHETDAQAAARIAANARRLAVQDSFRSTPAATHSWPTWAKVVFGMAACLLVGFAAGLVGTYDVGEEPAIGQSNPVPAAPGDYTGWIQYVDGKPQFRVPEGAQPLEMNEERTTPLIFPADNPRIPK
jgi:hypothetical protein